MTGTKVAAMKKHRSSAVRLLRFHIHIGHGEVSALRRELEPLNFVRIVETFELNAVAFVFIGIGGRQHGERADQNCDDKAC